MLNVIAIMFYIIIEVDVPILGLDKTNICTIITVKYKIEH